MKRYLPFAIIFVVAASSVTAGALIFRAKRAELAAAFANIATSPNASAGAQPPHVQGEAKATVTLEEFGDFQCPPCANVAVSLGSLEKEFGPQLRVIFRNYPLAMHNHAEEAARAAEAAGLQGKFWQMHEALYRNQNAWARESNVQPLFASYARAIGLDLARYQNDVDGEAVKQRVEADRQRATSLGVTSTPTFFLNGHALPPTMLNEQSLRATVAAVVRGEPLPKLTTPTPAPNPASTSPP